MTKADSDFFARVLVGLGMTRQELARALDMKPSELLNRHGTRLQLSEVDSDPLWIEIAMIVDERIGELIGVREELNRKMAVERRRRAEYRKKVYDG